MYIFLNQQLIHEKEAMISVFDHGFLYGLGFFETFRTYEGVPFLLEEHLERLQQATKRARIQWEPNVEGIKDQVSQLLEANHLKEGYFRFNVSAGAAPVGLPSSAYEQPTELLFCKALPSQAQQKRLVTVTVPRNTPEDEIRYKSHHYLNNILAKYETPEGYEGIFLTAKGYVAEGVVSNLFFVKGGQLYTPSLSTGILAGITRSKVISLAEGLNIEVCEGEFTLQEGQTADEVFVTNSIQELVPVSTWDEAIFEENSNPVTRKLQQAYHAYVKSMSR